MGGPLLSGFNCKVKNKRYFRVAVIFGGPVIIGILRYDKRQKQFKSVFQIFCDFFKSSENLRKSSENSQTSLEMFVMVRRS